MGKRGNFSQSDKDLSKNSIANIIFNDKMLEVVPLSLGKILGCLHHDLTLKFSWRSGPAQ